MDIRLVSLLIMTRTFLLSFKHVNINTRSDYTQQLVTTKITDINNGRHTITYKSYIKFEQYNVPCHASGMIKF